MTKAQFIVQRFIATKCKVPGNYYLCTARELTDLLRATQRDARVRRHHQSDSLRDIAADLFNDLCEGDGKHSERLDKALILKHLRRALGSSASE